MIEEPSHAVEIARNDLANALGQLRYSAQVAPINTLLVNSDETEEQFLAQVIAWINAFGGVLQAVSETTTSMAAELQDLRSQRKAVRDFLGLTPREGTA